MITSPYLARFGFVRSPTRQYITFFEPVISAKQMDSYVNSITYSNVQYQVPPSTYPLIGGNVGVYGCPPPYPTN